MRMASPSMVDPPSYPVPDSAPDADVASSNVETATRATPASNVSNSTGTRSKGVVPVPHFDSILRAAPALDADVDLEELDDSASSSTLSLPDQVNTSEGSSLQKILRPHIEHHTSLHAYLDANSALEELILQTREKLHIDAGKVKSTFSRVNRLERIQLSLKSEGEKKGKIFWSPKKKRDWRRQVETTRSELDPVKAIWHESERDLQEDRQKLRSLEAELVEYEKVQARLDAIDDEIFSGTTHGHSEEDELEQRYHILGQTQRRLLSAVQLETRAQGHLNAALQLCTILIKELLVGLNVGIDAGIPTNTKHKTGLWRGTSSTHSAKLSRSHILRAKTIVGELHTKYILARAAQKRVAGMIPLEVIELNRLPGMNAKNVVDEAGFHRSLEQSYAQSKAGKAHIENQIRLSKGRQASLKRNIKELQREARGVWLELRQKRREIVEINKEKEGSNGVKASSADSDSLLPPYKRSLISSSSVLAFESKGQGIIGNDVSLPRAFRRRVDRESMEQSRLIVRRVAIEVGGMVEEDRVADDEILREEEDLPGFELSFR
ncbi:hypothetical protein CBS101457_004162 [Exobasidium rhododendri]|nr:hypothetical protein CBS101457_004162 [Exobasidium rhododendri]